MSKLIKDFGQSKVYDWGIGVNFRGLYEYDIRKDRVYENDPDWITHMAEKNWVDLHSFKQALDFAKDLYNHKRSSNV